MLFSNDLLVLLLVVLFFMIWGIIAFRRWFYREPVIAFPTAPDGAPIRGAAVDLLTEQGYEVIHGKWKIGIKVCVDDEELGSSLFIDYFAKHNDDYYVVKLAKSRKPLDVSAGSAVREMLLPYALLYEQTAGVLYVDVDHRKIYKIRFELEL